MQLGSNNSSFGSVDFMCKAVTYDSIPGYVSTQVFGENFDLENRFRNLPLNFKEERRELYHTDPPALVNGKDIILRKCGQTEFLLFEECYPESVLQNCQKIGEGVYGEVFLYRSSIWGTTVMKVIPIEGDQLVNGERQKRYEEILSEIIIAEKLSNLRDTGKNQTSAFLQVQKIQCVQGCYPEKLIELWDLFDETRGSENDSPEIFKEDQQYVVMELTYGGADMETFVFENASQAYYTFAQIAVALAIAEEELQFEHRDLHWGNVLLKKVEENKIVSFKLNGRQIDIETKGAETALIDFTMSRIECNGVVIYNDLGQDPELFNAKGDYQYELYRLMKQRNGNEWEHFEPYTNILWLHYILDKAILAVHYAVTDTKVHKTYINKLRELKNTILNYSSVEAFVNCNF